jgi:regulatory protein
MRITAIKQQVKNPERVSVFVDDKYSFSLSLDELLQQKIKNGDELGKGDIKRLQKLSADGKLKMRSLEWLLSRPRSTREFRDYLYRKKTDQALVDKLIKDFTDRGYLDDRKFGEWFVELQKRRQKSDRAVRAELFKKGIDRELTDELLESETEPEINRLKQLAEKKGRLPRYQKDPQKLTEYLVRQGYAWSDVKQVLNINQPED